MAGGNTIIMYVNLNRTHVYFFGVFSVCVTLTEEESVIELSCCRSVVLGAALSPHKFLQLEHVCSHHRLKLGALLLQS